MTPKDIRTAISNQCGFNKAKHRKDLQVKLSPERLAQLESICQHHPNKAKTQPQRLLESIIPNKADSDLVKPEPVADNATNETGKAPAGCNYGNPNAVEIIECGCCGAYHRAAFYGDCRDDSERFADPEDFEARWYGGGYPSVEVFPEETTPNKAVQVCNAGKWPDHLPSSFEDWLRSNNDAIDIGGNEIPSRVQANHDRYDNERHPFA